MSWSSPSRVKCICRFRGGGNVSKPSLNQFLRLTPERCDQKSFREWDQLVTEMGCAPSKSAVVYSEDKMCRDWDTCSTFVPNLPSFVSPPDKPQRSDESSSGGQTFSNVQGLAVSPACRSSGDRVAPDVLPDQLGTNSNH